MDRGIDVYKDAKMIELLRRISIDNKLRLLSMVPLVLLVLVSGFMVWQLYTESVENRKVATRQTVEAALAIVDWAHSLETSGEVSRDKAQQMALQALNRARYSGKEYFWVNDMNHKMVMHPTKPEQNGKDLSDMTDPDGTKVFVQFVDTVRQNKAGFVHYRWPKPGQDEPVAKVSYVTGFEPWGWVVGSGVYIDDLKAEFFHHLTVMGGMLGGALALSIFIGGLVSRIIKRGIQKAVRVADSIAEGDISQPIDVKGSDEIAQLLQSMRKMSEHLTQTMREVHEAADSLSQASKEIAAGNGDLSSRTEETAASLQQTAASMDQLTGSVRQSADSASEANHYVDTAAGVAERGGEVVSQVVATMDGINQASKKISDIIGVIDGIAFQTNILALNAAVEAARAGEQGRGFAVVAGEVRTLAQRSANAAREIKALINASVDQVESGSQLVQSAGTTMHDIVNSVQQVNAIIRDITMATSEQRDGISQINTAVSQLDQMTQQNAALVEQSAAAAESLYEQAVRLSQVVGRFKLNNDRVRQA